MLELSADLLDDLFCAWCRQPVAVCMVGVIGYHHGNYRCACARVFVAPTIDKKRWHDAEKKLLVAVWHADVRRVADHDNAVHDHGPTCAAAQAYVCRTRVDPACCSCSPLPRVDVKNLAMHPGWCLRRRGAESTAA